MLLFLFSLSQDVLRPSTCPSTIWRLSIFDDIANASVSIIESNIIVLELSVMHCTLYIKRLFSCSHVRTVILLNVLVEPVSLSFHKIIPTHNIRFENQTQELIPARGAKCWRCHT